MKQEVSLVITDLDNTLYDWLNMWFQSFSAMITHLTKTTGIDQAVLEHEIRKVFQKYGTSEYAFVVQELPILRSRYSEEEIKRLYESARKVYRKARNETLRLYPTVRETLETLKAKRCRIAVFTESLAFYTNTRMRKLGLDGLVDDLFSPRDHPVSQLQIREARRYSDEYYTLEFTQVGEIKEGESKPNPHILREIVTGVGGSIDRTIYVGDSLIKDISMAQDAGITDVYAKYGAAQHTEAYELLRRVSHWKEEDVQRERLIHQRGTVIPSYVLERSFSEILDLFEFIPAA